MDHFDIVGEPHKVPEHDWLEHYLVLAAKGTALIGGLLFCALVVMSIISIVGRKIGSGPITGDMELMQTGTAIAAAALLPYCTIMADHLKVEFFTENMRPEIRGILDSIGNLLLALLFGVLSWRTFLQALDGIDGEVTTLLSIPVWIPTMLLVPCFVLSALCALHLAWDHIIDLKKAPT